MGKAAKASMKPVKMDPPTPRNAKGRPVGNVPDGAKPMVAGEKAYNDAPVRPRPFR